MKDLVITLSDKPDGEQLETKGLVYIDVTKMLGTSKRVMTAKFLQSVFSSAQDKIFSLFNTERPVFFTIKNIITDEVVMFSGYIESVETLDTDGVVLNYFVIVEGE